ncbi:MAG: 1-acyl-sn-glycerol-3-phosphate acyltransferase [archaeon]|nr:1-acyl-sn-glycerol-3-phosphate acyltransferase [archaeon]
MGLFSFLIFLLEFPFNHPILTFIYLILNFIFALFIKHKVRKFYDKNWKVNEQYPEFRRYDSFSFIRLYLGLVFFVYPKAILFCISLGTIAFVVSIGDIKKYHPIKEWFFRNFTGFNLILFGNVRPQEIIKDDKLNTLIESVYKKYLGPEYIIDYNKKYATIIGNHCSYVDSFYYTYRYGSSFVSKQTILNVPFVNKMAQYNHSLFLDRTKKEEREKTAQEIAQRQREIMEGKYDRVINVFPEGTITSGKYIINFKRGAFMSLLPLKPLMELTRRNNEFETSSGAMSLLWHIIISANYHYSPVDFMELPVIEPTEFMYENYKNMGNEKWEIFMNVTRHIMSECSGLELKDSGYSKKLEFLSLIKGKKVKNT